MLEYEKNFMTREKANTQLLLNSLISLRQQLSHIDVDISKLTQYATNSYLVSLEEQLSKEDIKLITNWCKKYGLPFVGEPQKNFFEKNLIMGELYQCFGFENDYLSCETDSKLYFRVGVFLVGLSILYAILVYAINIKNEIKLNVDIDAENFPTVKADSNDLIVFINNSFKSSPIYFNIDFSNAKHLKFNLSTETALSVALYHLALCIISPNPNLRARRCDNCNNIFLSSRANSTHCISCNRSVRYRQRLNQKNKKEDLENGKHKSKKE